MHSAFVPYCYKYALSATAAQVALSLPRSVLTHFSYIYSLWLPFRSLWIVLFSSLLLHILSSPYQIKHKYTPAREDPFLVTNCNHTSNNLFLSGFNKNMRCMDFVVIHRLLPCSFTAITVVAFFFFFDNIIQHNVHHLRLHEHSSI